MRVMIWLYATNRPHLLWERPDDRQRRAGLALAAFPALIYLLAVLVAAAAPTVSLLIYASALRCCTSSASRCCAKAASPQPGVRGLHLTRDRRPGRNLLPGPGHPAAVPGAGLGRRLRRAAHRRAGRPASQPRRPGRRHRRCDREHHRGGVQAATVGRPRPRRAGVRVSLPSGVAPGAGRPSAGAGPAHRLRVPRRPAVRSGSTGSVVGCGCLRPWPPACRVAHPRPSSHSGRALDRRWGLAEGGRRPGRPHLGQLRARPPRPPVPRVGCSAPGSPGCAVPAADGQGTEHGRLTRARRARARWSHPFVPLARCSA